MNLGLDSYRRQIRTGKTVEIPIKEEKVSEEKATRMRWMLTSHMHNGYLKKSRRSLLTKKIGMPFTKAYAKGSFTFYDHEWIFREWIEWILSNLQNS